MRQTTRQLDQSPSSMTSEQALCRECQTGRLRLQHLTYFTWLNEELITVPNFPAWVCDVCGRREYDLKAIHWLNTLLDPQTGKRSVSRRKSRYTGADQAQA